MKKTALLILALTFGLNASCESGHWIDAVMDNGALIKLEDGSLWKVSSLDTINSSIWLPISNITACDYRLINTDDNEVVEAQRIN